LDYLAKTDMVNRESSFYARTQFGRDGEAARQAVAAAVGAAPDEVALTRGATEALQLLIGGYNKLQPGDTVLYSDLDYDSMQYAMNWLKERRGVNVVKFSIPEPATRGAVLQTYQKVLADHPKAALLLVARQPPHRPGDAGGRDCRPGARPGGRCGAGRRPLLGPDRLQGAGPRGGFHRFQPA
jgi:selenocysteine lyase/cysteine desulfurase